MKGYKAKSANGKGRQSAKLGRGLAQSPLPIESHRIYSTPLKTSYDNPYKVLSAREVHVRVRGLGF